jgi:hypothetical protein
LDPADGSCRRRQNVVLVVIVVVNLKHAALHEEGGYEGGDDRQDEVADLLGGNVLEKTHSDIIISINTFYKCLRIIG